MHRIKELLTQKGESMESLSVKLGVTPQALYANMQAPSFKKLKQIAEALGVELWELFADGREIAARYQEQHPTPDALRCPRCGARLTIKAED